jgi:hypothetical protein
MQSSHLDIYKQVAAKTGKSEQMYKDIGSFIFKETSRMLKNPSSLILKLKGVGTWHLRRKRMEIVVNEWTDRSEVKTREDFTSDAGYNNYLEKHLRYINFQERLKEYEKYVEIKRQIRLKRNETQPLLEPDKGEDERFKSG